MNSEINHQTNIVQKVLLGSIGLYQKTLSPDHGWFRARFPHGFCRFYPSCSEYCKQSILKHGIYKGVVFSAIRIVRCNPFTKPQIHTP